MSTPSEKDLKRLKKEKKELKKKRKRDSLSATPATEKKRKPKIEEEEDSDVNMDISPSTPAMTSKNPPPKKSSSKKDKKKDSSSGSVGIKVMKDSSTSAPLVVSFPNGVPSVAHNSPSFTWSVQKRKTVAGKVLGKQVQGHDRTCNFSSHVVTSNASSKETSRLQTPMTKFMVGVFDKETNSLTLHLSAEDGKIFPLQQTIRSSNADNNDSDDENGNQYGTEEHFSLANMTEAEKRRVLFDSFGSAKKKKQLKGIDANKVNVSSVVGTDTNMLDAVNRQNLSKSNVEAMKEATIAAKQQITENAASSAVQRSYEEARKLFLPPFNPNAQLPHLIYDPKRICDEASWGQISRTVDACIYKAFEGADENNPEGAGGTDDANESWVNSLTSRGGTWSKPVLDIFNTIQDPTYNKPRIKCILLLHYILNFYKFFSRSKHNTVSNITVEKIAARIRLSYDVAPRLLHLFTTRVHENHTSAPPTPSQNTDSQQQKHQTSGSYTMDKPHLNKCLAHILLLYIMAHGKEMKVGSINGLVHTLQIELSVANNLLRQSGCTVTKKVGGTIAVSLNAPLKFPPPKRMKR